MYDAHAPVDVGVLHFGYEVLVALAHQVVLRGEDSPDERPTMSTLLHASDVGFDVRWRLQACINGPQR